MIHEEIIKEFEDFTPEQVIGIFANHILLTHGEDAVVSAKNPCCPPNTCGVCVNNVCVPCAKKS